MWDSRPLLVVPDDGRILEVDGNQHGEAYECVDGNYIFFHIVLYVKNICSNTFYMLYYNRL